MYYGPITMLGVLLWHMEDDEGTEGKYWTFHPGCRFHYVAGRLYFWECDKAGHEPEVITDLPTLTLKEAVAFTLGLNAGAKALVERERKG